MHAFHLLLADTLLIVVDMLAALPGIAAFRQQFLARAFTIEVQIAYLGNKLVYALIAALILRAQQKAYDAALAEKKRGRWQYVLVQDIATGTVENL